VASIGKVSAVFTASTSGLTAGVKAAGSSFRSLQSDTKGLESAMKTLVAINGAQLFASVASSALSSVRSLVSFGQAQAEVIDSASKLAARLGMTYGEFAGLSLAADLAGVSMDTIGKASQKAEIAFAKAAGGSKIATAAFAGLGLSVADLNGMSAADRFDAIASAIAALPTEAQRAAAAVQLFGKAGAELLPLFGSASSSIDAARAQAEKLGATLTGLKTPEAFDALANLGFDDASIKAGIVSFDDIAAALQGIQGDAQRSAAAVAIFGRSGEAIAGSLDGSVSAIAAARAEAERLGLTLTNAQGQNVEAMNDSFTMVQKSIQGVVQQVVAYLAPAITAISEQFTTLVGDIGGANIGQAIGDGILAGARFLAGVGDYLIANFGSTFSYLSQVGEQWEAALGIGSSVANLFYGAFKVFESVGNGVGFLIAKVAEKLLSAAASLTSVLPGYERQNANLQTASMNMSTWADNSLSAMTGNMQAAGEAFGNAFTGTTSSSAAAIAGPLVTSLDASIAAAVDAANSVDEASSKPVQLNQTVVVDVAQAIKGIDSRSTEGITEMFRIMRGGAGDVQEQQLSVLEEIAANTGGEGFTVVEGF
jgi:hypothetical protein